MGGISHLARLDTAINPRDFLCLERRLLGGKPAPRKAPPPRPPQGKPHVGFSPVVAARILEALASTYQPGDTVSGMEVTRLTGLAQSTVNHYLRELEADPGWVYAPTMRRRGGRL